MKKNAMIAMVAALTVTTAAGVGIGGYMLGRHTDRTVISTEAASDGTAAKTVTATVTPSSVATAATASTTTAAATTASTTTASSATAEKAVDAPRQFTVKPADYIVYCAVPDLNVRTAPEVAHSSVVGCVKEGQALHVTGEVESYTWLQVDFNGKTCYVSTPYVQKNAPSSEKKEESKNTTPAVSEEVQIVSLDGVGYTNEVVSAGMTAADAKDALLWVGGVDVNGKNNEMQVIDVTLYRCSVDGTSQPMANDQVLESGNAYFTKVTVEPKKVDGKSIHFAGSLGLSQELSQNFSLDSVGSDTVILSSHFHTV